MKKEIKYMRQALELLTQARAWLSLSRLYDNPVINAKFKELLERVKNILDVDEATFKAMKEQERRER